VTQRQQGERAALAAVVGAHDDGHILERDQDHDRPEDERQDAVGYSPGVTAIGWWPLKISFSAYSGLVPMSPKTTPIAATVSAGSACFELK
jgi:hypothetical protein